FFVISGFLLGGSLIRQQQNRAFRGYWVFYRKRLYRILPLFLLALLLYGAGSWHGDWYSLLVNLLFIENNFNDATKLIPVGWSLSIEMQFYLVLPLLVVFTGRSLPYWLLGLLFLALVLRTFGVFADGRFYEISFLDYLAGKADATLLLDNIYYPTWMRFGRLVMDCAAPLAATATQ
ncbi:MAG: acyltransferase, partial [Moraxella osloensis]|nr:acyltransferase [Moraxella osloensis]